MMAQDLHKRFELARRKFAVAIIVLQNIGIHYFGKARVQQAPPYVQIKILCTVSIQAVN